MTDKPIPLPVIFENIPSTLKTLTRWCVWRYHPKRDGKEWSKIPIQADGERWGSSKNPDIWMNYETARKLYESGNFSGVGIYMNAKGGKPLNDGFDNLIGLDWDHIAGNDEIIQEVLSIGSYCELSPSGTGYRCFAVRYEPLDRGFNKRGFREVYASGKFLTITGHVLEGSCLSVERADEEGFKTFYDRLKADKTGKTTNPHPKTIQQEKPPKREEQGLSDDAVLLKALEYYGNRFKSSRIANLTGDLVSETDLTFCNYIAIFCDSAIQTARIFQRERDRDKTRTRPDYIQRTAEKAFNERKWIYDPGTDSLLSVDRPLNSDNIIIPINDTGLDELTETTYRAIIEKFKGSPVLFQRSGNLFRVKRDEHDRAFLAIGDRDTLTHLACKSCNFVRKTQKGTTTRVFPPNALGINLMQMHEWPGIPPIIGITNLPLIHTDGSIRLEPGYDEATKYFYDSRGLSLPSLPSTPSKIDVNESLGLFMEPFNEFPWSDSQGMEGSSYANFLACAFTAFVRHLINGPVPMLLIHKPSMGTGASKLCEVLSAIVTGDDPDLLQEPSDDSEWRKSLTTKLLRSTSPIVVLDNFEKKISNPHFSSLLTSSTWSDRMLGHNQDIRIPHKTIWIANGNNIRLGSDLPRRTYASNLDAHCARPWERVNFTIPDVLGYSKANRAEIIASALTIIKGWVLAGMPKWSRPEKIKPLGGFEAWTDTIGGILDYAGITGFLHNQQESYEQIDVDGPAWDAFFEAWYGKFKDDEITVRELCQLMHDEEVHNPFEPLKKSDDDSKEVTNLSELIPDGLSTLDFRSQRFKVIFGTELTRNTNRVFPSGYVLKNAGTCNRAKKWRVEKLETVKEPESAYESPMSLQNR